MKKNKQKNQLLWKLYEAASQGKKICMCATEKPVGFDTVVGTFPDKAECEKAKKKHCAG